MRRRALPKPLIAGRIDIPLDDQTYVYRAYCRCGEILYVGVTVSLFKRLYEHRVAGAKWVRRMDRLEWDLFATRHQAERVETALIQELDPPYNIAGRGPRVPRWKPLPDPLPARSPAQREADELEAVIAAHRALAIGDRI